MSIPDLTDLEFSSFNEYNQDPEVIPLEISEEDVQWVAYKLSGAAGPSLIDTLAFKICLLCFVLVLASVREEMAEWTYWLANYSPPWAAYHANISARLFSLGKSPGLMPVGIR